MSEREERTPAPHSGHTWPTRTLQVQLGQRRYPVKYPFSPAMKHVITDVFQGREYPLCLPDDLLVETIIDIGGNVGAAAIWFHHRYPNARIISYEPSPLTFQFLSENTASIDNIEAKNIGLSDRDGEFTLHSGMHHAAQSSLVPHQETSNSTEKVTLRRASLEFSAIGIGRISILKVDTEGCEVPILVDIGARLDQIDSIYVEYHSEADRREIDQILAQDFYLIRAIVRRANLGLMVFLAKKIADRDRKYASPPLERPQ